MDEVDLVFLKKGREFLEQHGRQSAGKPFFLFHSALLRGFEVDESNSWMESGKTRR